MATLGQLGELLGTELRERIDGLVSAVEGETPDLTEIARLADAVGELADRIGGIYGELDELLTRGLQRGAGSGRDDEDSQERARREPGPQSSKQHAASVDDATKEELLERAREVNVHGRASMSKEELSEAVEAEESLTREELLERARQAGVEGRSSMRKEELRAALSEAGA